MSKINNTKKKKTRSASTKLQHALRNVEKISIELAKDTESDIKSFWKISEYRLSNKFDDIYTSMNIELTGEIEDLVKSSKGYVHKLDKKFKEIFASNISSISSDSLANLDEKEKEEIDSFISNFSFRSQF